NLILESGDELASAQSQLVVFSLAAVKLLAVHIAVKVDVDHIAIFSSTILHSDNAGVALAHTVDLAVNVFRGDFHRHLGNLDALVALNGGLGLSDNVQFALNALVLADLVNFELANADDLQAGLLHSLH